MQTISHQSELSIEYCSVDATPSAFYPSPDRYDLSEGYRIICGKGENGKGRALLTKFVRERDALAAKAALEREGVCTADAIRRAGREAVERIMAEAMAW